MPPIYARHPQLAGRVVGDLAFVVTAHDNKLITLNTTATRIWELFAEPRKPDEVADILCAEFEVGAEQARLDLQECLDDLIKREILVIYEG